MKVKTLLKEEIISKSIAVPIAPKDIRWSKKSLGEFANESGIYFHSFEDKIIYIGKATSGTYGTFGERMRRELHETSSSNNNLHRDLKAFSPDLKTSFLTLDNISDLDEEFIKLYRALPKERKALAAEQILIGHFNPEVNRI
jgi:hypothetical protein